MTEIYQTLAIVIASATGGGMAGVWVTAGACGRRLTKARTQYETDSATITRLTGERDVARGKVIEAEGDANAARDACSGLLTQLEQRTDELDASKWYSEQRREWLLQARAERDEALATIAAYEAKAPRHDPVTGRFVGVAK